MNRFIAYFSEATHMVEKDRRSYDEMYQSLGTDSFLMITSQPVPDADNFSRLLDIFDILTWVLFTISMLVVSTGIFGFKRVRRKNSFQNILQVWVKALPYWPSVLCWLVSVTSQW